MKKLKNNLIKLSKFSKKVLVLFTVLCVSLSTIGVGNIMTILAENEDQYLTLEGGTADGNYIKYYDGETLMGTVLAKIYGDTKTPNGNKITLPEYSDPYQVMFYITLESGYDVENVLVNGLDAGLIAGDMTKGISITSGSSMTVTFNFKTASEGPGGPGGPGEFAVFPIVAYFNGIEDPVESNEFGDILLPDDWTDGTVTFKAKVCEVDGKIVPNDGINVCDTETEREYDLNIQGIANREQVNNTVSGSEDGKHIIVSEDFKNYGKVGIHLTNEDLNLVVNLIHEDLINIEASAPLAMSYSYGTSTVDQVILTNSETGDVSIFFGNMETTLIASGPKVKGIKNVVGGISVNYDNDGGAIISLPDLSVETITPVTLTIEMLDNSTVTRKVNIIRTAIMLAIDGETKALKAGYVINKAYLYNNQSHNSEIFDAYLQVILYKDNVVAGYRQVQIDDEEIVNSLNDDESTSIEVVGERPIILYTGDIEGVNKASVFLTNGPIDYKSDTLPPVEFGIGAGVQIEWGK